MLGNRIKSLRESRNLSQVQLAVVLHVSKQSISNWENENIFPSVEMLVKIAQYFSTTTDYLVGLDNHRWIDVSDLPQEAVAHIQMLIEDIRKLNASMG